ncbi:AraC family transcriptional regulator [Shimia biformata]|uniref:AraC family transcriptional regulator n=1 Tax=Shimia biformata TaxID=1294299 RepID=UPI00194F0960|nr:AraC family transcriptional regulator [Shimia biformata]
MSKHRIKQIIENRVRSDGLIDTGIEGVQLFRASSPIPCAPVAYEPCVIAIVSGTKEAVLEGAQFIYDSDRYLLCPMSMPVQAGTPAASPDNLLLGAYISLDPRVMAELVMEMESAGSRITETATGTVTGGIRLARWGADFSDALLRLLQLLDSPADMAVLGAARLRELHYTVLKGEAGDFARQAFGAGNGISRSIAHLSANLDAPVSIEDLAARAGMSRAVFHRKFKQATSMSPIQFVKSMRLNNAAMKIAGGTTVAEAAMDVGYVSPSQFSREFKRLYGQSPRKWGGLQVPANP